MNHPRSLASAIVATGGLWAATATASSTPADVESVSIQAEFAKATNLKIEQRWQDLPADAATALNFMAKNFPAGTHDFANLGEEWSPTDAVRGDVPQALHLFSAHSATVAASVILTGGSRPTFYALLVPVHAPSRFCVYKLPPLSPAFLRLSVVQNLLRPDRDQTAEPTPTCQLQLLDEPLIQLNTQ